MWWICVTAALASEYVENFDDYADVTPFSGTDGWVGGDPLDGWKIVGGRVANVRDEPFGTWGSGTSADNHLVQTSKRFTDLTFDANFRTQDDDTLGFVVHYVDSKNFFLVFFSDGGSYPTAPTGAVAYNAAGGRLYAVVDGVATQLDTTNRTFSSAETYPVRIEVVGSHISVWLDWQINGFNASDLVLEGDDARLPVGNIGLYTYDSGEPECSFDDIVVVGIDPDLDADGDGANEDVDCDDTDPLRTQERAWYTDADGDGFGTGDPAVACFGPVGSVTNNTDCDDAASDVNPLADEVCGGIDEDCSGESDDSAIDALAWYPDADGDGFGVAADRVETCAAPDGYVDGRVGFDCDDTDATVFPGADDPFYDDVDQNCDGNPGVDADGDGAAGGADGTDCDDTRADISPEAVDRPDDGIDQNCSGDDAHTEVGGSCGCASGSSAGFGAWLIPAVVLWARRRTRALPSGRRVD